MREFYQSYGPIGGFIEKTAVPNFSALALFTNTRQFIESSALSTVVKGALVTTPLIYGWLNTTTGANLLSYPGMAATGANLMEKGTFWTNNGKFMRGVFAVPIVAITFFSTTAHGQALYICKDF